MEGTDEDVKSSAPAGHGSIVTKPVPFRPLPSPSSPADLTEVGLRQQLDGMFSSTMFMSPVGPPGDLSFLHPSFQSFSSFNGSFNGVDFFRMDSPGGLGSFNGLASQSSLMDMAGLLGGPSPSQEPLSAAPSAKNMMDDARGDEEPRMTTRSGTNHAKPPLSVRPPVPGGGGGSFGQRLVARIANSNNSSLASLAGRQSTARFKAPSAITMPGPRTTNGNYLTIPTGLSPTTLLDSPVLLSTSQAEPSPTTGTFPLPPHYNGSGSAAGAITSADGQTDVKLEQSSSSGFLFKPIPAPVSSAPNPPLAVMQQVKAEPEPAEASTARPELEASSRADEVAAAGDMDEQDGRGRVAAASHQLREVVSSDDGYNWRKYGQKQVKGCARPRSYYKCTHVGCSVKKKVERSEDGTLIENVVKGLHNHPKPIPNRSAPMMPALEPRDSRDMASGGGWGGFQPQGGAELADSPEAMGQAGRAEAGWYVGEGGDATVCRPGRFPHLTPPSSPSQLSGDDLSGAGHTPTLTEEAEDEDVEPDGKRRKGEVGQRSSREPRVVVMTKSRVDILDDGYRWRKYGQKTVKGNPHPRSYYKCTFPDCGVRKHVERVANDGDSVMTTYEGKHTHELPAARSGAGALAVASIENKQVESRVWAQGSDCSPEPAVEEVEDQSQVGRGRSFAFGGGMLEDALGGGVMRRDEGFLRRKPRVGEGSFAALLSNNSTDGSLQMPATRGLTSHHQESGSGYALRSATMEGNSSSVFGRLGGGNSSAFRPGSTTKALPR
eukprot:TRINITY_DN17297_c0_g1_i1.p1 TRINITY_DN17297_c0_g1~~TRINITY_DN17297_c0_g1_i1.p1  ORF type:complete len:775 (+),score=139.48 TRINITY_DN17297_c0_g1_i1:382-2706(+)